MCKFLIKQKQSQSEQIEVMKSFTLPRITYKYNKEHLNSY